MAVAPGDIFRVVVGWDMPDEQLAANVLGLICSSGTGTDAQLLTAAASWVGTMYGTLASAVNQFVDLGETRIVKMSWTGTEWETSSVLGTFTPTFSATNIYEMLPHAVACTVTMPTANPRRKGKVKIPGFSEQMQDGSFIESSGITNLVNFATALIGGLVAGTAVMDYAVLGDDGTARLATGWIVRNILGSQRSRKPGVGV